MLIDGKGIQSAVTCYSHRTELNNDSGCYQERANFMLSCREKYAVA